MAAATLDKGWRFSTSTFLNFCSKVIRNSNFKILMHNQFNLQKLEIC